MILTKEFSNFVVHLSDWNVGEMKVSWEFSCWKGWIVSVFEVVVKVFQTVQDFKGLGSSSMDCNLLVFLVQIWGLGLKVVADFKLWEFLMSLERKLIEEIRLSNLKVRITVLLKRRKWWSSVVFPHEIYCHQLIKRIILLTKYLDIPLFGPWNDFLVPFFCIRRIVQVKADGVDLEFGVNLVEDLEVVPIKIVHLSLIRLHLLVEVFERLDHELNAVGGEVLVMVWVYLFGGEDKCWDDFLL
jgi:hypothetical protein